MPRRYTVKIHTHRLSKMLAQIGKLGSDSSNRENLLRMRCPAAPYLKYGNDMDDLWSEGVDPCTVCRSFIGIEKERRQCPCYAFKREGTAVRRSEKALEKFYKREEKENE